MSRATDIITAAYAARHCDDLYCGKCRARSRWNRRKARNSRKSRNRVNRNRKG